MAYKDLRGFIADVEQSNMLRRVRGAQTHLEIGGITGVASVCPIAQLCCSTTFQAFRMVFASSPIRSIRRNAPLWRSAWIQSSHRSTR